MSRRQRLIEADVIRNRPGVYPVVTGTAPLGLAFLRDVQNSFIESFNQRIVVIV